MRSFWTVLIGTILLMAGVIWLLFATHVVSDFGFLAHWWPLFLVVPFGLRLFLFPGKFISLLFLSLGVIFLLYANGWFIEDIWHVLYIAAPISVILIALHLLFDRDWRDGWFGRFGGGPRR